MNSPRRPIGMGNRNLGIDSKASGFSNEMMIKQRRKVGEKRVFPFCMLLTPD